MTMSDHPISPRFDVERLNVPCQIQLHRSAYHQSSIGSQRVQVEKGAHNWGTPRAWPKVLTNTSP